MPNQLVVGTLKLSPYSSKITPIPSASPGPYDVTNTPLISATILGADFFDTFNLLQNITVIPANVNVDTYIQGLAPDGTTWFDIAHLLQQTATGKEYYSFRPAGAWEFTVTDAALGPGLTNTINLPGKMRIKIAFSGVGTGNITIAVDMEFFRRRGIGGT